MEKVQHPLYEECEKLYQETTVRTPDGKYMVPLHYYQSGKVLENHGILRLRRLSQ